MIPLAMLLPGAAITSVVLLVYLLLLTINLSPEPILWFLVWLALIIGYSIIFHGKPWKRFGQLHKPPKLVVSQPQVYEKPLDRLKPQVGKVTINTRKKGEQLRDSAEDKVHLAEIVRFKLDGEDFGAYLLEDARGNCHIVWLFECEGISYSLTPQQYDAAAIKIQAALTDFSLTGTTETITFDACVRSSCVDEVEKVKALAKGAPKAEDRFVAKWIKERIEDLTRQGMHAPRYLRVYCTTNLSELHLQYEDDDLADKLMAWIENKIPGLKTPENIQAQLKEKLTQAYYDQYKKYKRILGDKMMLKVTSPSAQAAWQWAWSEVNEGVAPPPNSLLTLTSKNLIPHRSKSDVRLLASILLQNGAPFFDNKFVHLPGRGEYVGAAVMVATPNRKWVPAENPKARQEQLFYASEVINDSATVNTRLLAQYSAVSVGSERFAAMMRTRSENSVKLNNEKLQKKDVASETFMAESVEAEASLLKGNALIYCAVVALVYRRSVPELDDAMARLCEHSAYNGRIMLREKGYCDRLWLDAIPLVADKLLQKNNEYRVLCQHERRLKNEVAAMVGLAPLMKEQPVHDRGVQLVSKLRSPVFINPLGEDPYIHMIFAGANGAGKSVFTQAIGQYTCAMGGKTMIVDGSRADGSGSYREWVRFRGGSYFNPNRDFANVFDGVDRRKLVPIEQDDKDALDLWGTFESFLCNALTDLSYKGLDPERRSKVYNMNTNLVSEFFEWDQIRNRRAHAFDHGIGTTAWQNMPTLKDYVAFMSRQNMPEYARKAYSEEFISEYQSNLASLLLTRVGKAISSPTNFDGDAPLLVYALGGITNAEDMLPLAIATQGNLLVQLEKPGLKTFVLEEASVNLQFPSLCIIPKIGWAKGRKLDLHCVLVSQGMETVMNSIAAADIKDNTFLKVVGRIANTGVPHLSKSLDIPEEILWQCTQGEFFPGREMFARHFLIDYLGNYTFANYFTDFASLGLTMNAGEEQRLKDEFQALYPDDKYRRITEIANHLRSKSIHAKI